VLIDAGVRTAQRDGLSASVRIWSMVRCRALLAAGRLGDAAAEAEATIEMGDDIGDGSYGYVSHMALYVLGQVALHTGDTAGLAQARRSGTRLRAADRCSSAQRLGAWLLAVVAGKEGDSRRAAEAGVQALDPLAIGPLPGTSPRTYADTADLTRILVHAGQRGEAARAVARLEDFAARHPTFPSWTARRPASGGPRSSREWPQLTESEFAVASLVAQGATNRAVAERLYLSPYTVNSHLRHVFAKLGIRSPAELAYRATAHGISLIG
jgi:DNA-binding CsgD family transcriptional regulator